MQMQRHHPHLPHAGEGAPEISWERGCRHLGGKADGTAYCAAQEGVRRIPPNAPVPAAAAAATAAATLPAATAADATATAADSQSG